MCPVPLCAPGWKIYNAYGCYQELRSLLFSSVLLFPFIIVCIFIKKKKIFLLTFPLPLSFSSSLSTESHLNLLLFLPTKPPILKRLVVFMIVLEGGLMTLFAFQKVFILLLCHYYSYFFLRIIYSLFIDSLIHFFL